MEEKIVLGKSELRISNQNSSPGSSPLETGLLLTSEFYLLLLLPLSISIFVLLIHICHDQHFSINQGLWAFLRVQLCGGPRWKSYSCELLTFPQILSPNGMDQCRIKCTPPIEDHHYCFTFMHRDWAG